MTTPIPQSQAQTPAVTATTPSSANAATAGAVASANSGGELNTNTKINSMDDLKKKAPKLYQKMLEGIGMAICNDMRDHQERIKRLMRESRTQG